MPEMTEAQQLRHALVTEKHAQATHLLATTGIDCWLTFCREGSDLLLPYVMGGEYMAGTTALMLFADGTSVAVVRDYDVSQVQETFQSAISYTLDWQEPLLSSLREKNPASIAINFSEEDHGIDGLTYGLYRLLERVLRPAGFADRLISSAPVAERVRAIKTPSEVERMRRACAITQRIFDDLTGMLKPGLTESDIAEIIRERMITYGVEGPAWEASFCPSVASSKSPRGHTPPGAVVLEAGDALAIDFGVIYEGYCSDMQRTWYFRKPGETTAPEELRRAFEAVRDGIVLAAELTRPGLTGIAVDSPVRKLVADRGYTFTHALGHQLGRMAHDGGMLLGPDNAIYGERAKGIIEEGMVFTLEPCIGPIGGEDDVVVTANGCEFLAPMQTEIYLV